MSPTTQASGQVRPRYGRIGAFTGAMLSTLVTVSAGLGLLPSGGAPAEASPRSDGAIQLATGFTRIDPGALTRSGPVAGLADARAARESADLAVAPPADSGEGRRVVFDMSRQRVWLVNADDEVERTYLVSGSVTDNLRPGTYEVYSRSKDAQGIDGSTMDHMVRFAHGKNAAIGFHDIPEMNGEPVQTRAQLGTPLSHGCVRQAEPDARALWRFAPVGTQVLVTD